MIKNLELDASWKKALSEEYNSEYMSELHEFIVEEKNLGHTIYPSDEKIFTIFNSVPFDSVKVVILGQDPYHGEGQAHGLSFSVPQGIKQPPSLKNIFKELHSDVGVEIPEHGDLTHWAKQGVLLLNAILTVRASQAASHHGRGWERFTDAVIHTLSSHHKNLVFILWGTYAQKKEHLIDTSKHLVITSVHPSPLSAYKGFFGSKPFSRANTYLRKHAKEPIDWTV